MIGIYNEDTIHIVDNKLEISVGETRYVYEKENVEALLMITNDLGPFYDDMGLAIRIDEKTAFMLMSEHPLFSDFLFEELKTIIEIDYEAVIKASCCTDNNVFPIYVRENT